MSKYIIGLDLSLKCTGYSKFDLKGNLVEFKKIKPKTTLSTLEKLSYIVLELHKIFIIMTGDIEKVIIEDIYLAYFRGKNQVKGFASLARLSGAVISMLIIMIDGKPVDGLITLRNASEARPIVGLSGSCQKANVQIWALSKFTDFDISDYEGLVEAIQAKKIIKDIDHKEYKNRMAKVSKLIEDETDFGEDISDAILLGYGETLTPRV